MGGGGGYVTGHATLPEITKKKMLNLPNENIFLYEK